MKHLQSPDQSKLEDYTDWKWERMAEEIVESIDGKDEDDPLVIKGLSDIRLRMRQANDKITRIRRGKQSKLGDDLKCAKNE